jgi:hypothetical protein
MAMGYPFGFLGNYCRILTQSDEKVALFHAFEYCQNLALSPEDIMLAAFSVP